MKFKHLNLEVDKDELRQRLDPRNAAFEDEMRAQQPVRQNYVDTENRYSIIHATSRGPALPNTGDLAEE